MKVVWYSLARIGVFAATLLALWLIGWFDIIAIFAAFVLAWLISYLALHRLRQAALAQMASMLNRSKSGIRDLNAEEDAELDRASEVTKSDPNTDRE